MTLTSNSALLYSGAKLYQCRFFRFISAGSNTDSTAHLAVPISQQPGQWNRDVLQCLHGSMLHASRQLAGWQRRHDDLRLPGNLLLAEVDLEPVMVPDSFFDVDDLTLIEHETVQYCSAVSLTCSINQWICRSAHFCLSRGSITTSSP